MGAGQGSIPMIAREETATLLLCQRLRLVAYFVLVTGDAACAQEVFLEVCRLAADRLEGFDSEKHLFNWARMAGRNLGIEKVRVLRGEYAGVSPQCLAQLEEQWMEGDDVTSAEGLEALSRCLAEQPADAAEFLRMHFFEELSEGEIARRKKLSIREVRERLVMAQREVLGCVHRRLANA
jgi:DNA-directed RNA polymerase specialized sigma24 family protein